MLHIGQNLQLVTIMGGIYTTLLASVAGATSVSTLLEEGPPPMPVRWEDRWSATDPPCNSSNKQKALYIAYTLDPPLSASPATALAVETTWVSLSSMRAHGTNGVFAAQPFGTDGPGGYFGSQADGSTADGGLLFSVWDAKGKVHHGQAPGCPPQTDDDAILGDSNSSSPNSTWCNTLHSFPLSANCHRHCLDCGLHPGWYVRMRVASMRPLDHFLGVSLPS
jgi:hypothetical protein